MSLEAAASEMKISKRYLIALEEGRTECLPHPVYAKGFLKSYARLLELDPEEMGAVFARHHIQDDGGEILPAPVRGVKAAGGEIPRAGHDAVERHARRAAAGNARVPTTGDKPRGFRPSLWLVAPLFVVFIGLAWFFFANFGDSRGAGKADNAESVKPDAASPMPAPEQKADIPAGGDSQSRQSHGAAFSVQPGGAAPARPDAFTPSGLAAAPEKPASEAQFASSGRQTVEITAGKRAAGLEVATEDGQTRSFTLVRGQRLLLRFNDKISVRFVRAPSVVVKVNGKEHPFGGGAATGKSIIFP